MPSHLIERRFRARATPQHNAILPTEVPIPVHLRNYVPAIEADFLRWYVCTTAPQNERRAGESLRRETDRLKARGRAPFVTYAPCSTTWQKRKRGSLDLPRRELQTPIVRSYLFIGISHGITGDHLGIMSERNSERHNKHGLSSVLGSANGIPIALGEAAIGFLGRLAEEERQAGKHRLIGEARHEVGDDVAITGGAFASFTGTIMGVDDAAGRILAEVELFGRMTPIELSFDDVARAA